MKAALKKKWIAALRSGDYKQGEGFLREESETGEYTWCCLGVLADVAGCRFSKDGHLGKKTDHSDSYIPDRTAKRLGIGAMEGGGGPPYQRVLARMNDKPMSFKRIANWIEKNL